MGPGVYTETQRYTDCVDTKISLLLLPSTMSCSQLNYQKLNPPNSVTFMAPFTLTDLLSSKIFLPHCTKYLTLILALSLPSIR